MYPLGFDFEMGSSSDLFGKGVSLGFIWYPLGFDFEIGSPSDLFGRGVSLGFIWYPLGFDFEIGSMIAHALFAGQGRRAASANGAHKTALRP